MSFRSGRTILLLLAGLVAGLVASAVLVLIMAAGRTWLGISPPPEALPDRFAPTLSIDQFFDLFGRFGGYNGLKRFGIKAGLTGLIAVGALFGVVYGAVAATARARSARAVGGISRTLLAFAGGAVVVMWTATVIVAWPVLFANFRGLPPGQARIATMAGLFISYLIYAIVLTLAFRLLTRPVRQADPAPAPDEIAVQKPDLPALTFGRRAIVATGVGGLAALPAISLIRRLEDDATFAYDGRPYSGPGVQPITPNDKFYSVTKNVVDPDVAASVWGLQVGGLVDRGHTYDLDDLTALSSVEQETTLMCISNKTGAGLFSNAVWTGVPMATLLQEAGVGSDAVEVLLHAADGYTDTFSIERALDPTTLVVYRMNGEPLPRKHGYPARVIVPGLFGEKNVKWVTGIEVIDHDGQGFYEKQGWGPNFEIPTRSDIFAPQWKRTSKGDLFNDPFTVGRAVEIRGRAFGGNRGIASVEVSVDGGETWAPATIEYPGTRLTWSFWSYRWTPQTSGSAVILSRAVDGTGAPQIAETRGIVPQGATGYHRVTATVG